MDVAKRNQEILGVDLEYKNVYIDAENTRMIRAKLPDGYCDLVRTDVWNGRVNHPEEHDIVKYTANVLYIEHTDKIGVLKDDKDERVSVILGTDKTLVERKREGKTYLLVPLTKNHTFVCKGNSIDVDGEHIKSEIFFRKDACQWIEIDEETLSKVA